MRPRERERTGIQKGPHLPATLLPGVDPSTGRAQGVHPSVGRPSAPHRTAPAGSHWALAPVLVHPFLPALDSCPLLPGVLKAHRARRDMDREWRGVWPNGSGPPSRRLRLDLAAFCVNTLPVMEFEEMCVCV
jgi:hypothetical protein